MMAVSRAGGIALDGVGGEGGIAESAGEHDDVDAPVAPMAPLGDDRACDGASGCMCACASQEATPGRGASLLSSDPCPATSEPAPLDSQDNEAHEPQLDPPTLEWPACILLGAREASAGRPAGGGGACIGGTEHAVLEHAGVASAPP